MEDEEEVAPPVSLTAEGVRQLGALMDGIENDFLGMVRSCLQHPFILCSCSEYALPSTYFSPAIFRFSCLVTTLLGPEQRAPRLTSLDTS